VKPIDPRTLPALAHARLGTGRIKLDTLTPGDSKSILGYGSFVDSTSTCTPHVVNGVLRCLPHWVDLDVHPVDFADPACKQPVARPSDGDCETPTVAVTTLASGETVIYSLMPSSTRPVYEVTGGQCMQHGTRQVSELGPVIDPATFAVVFEKVE
jgi:hypothetical protein